jgi:hypothetical protein
MATRQIYMVHYPDGDVPEDFAYENEADAQARAADLNRRDDCADWGYYNLFVAERGDEENWGACACCYKRHHVNELTLSDKHTSGVLRKKGQRGWQYCLTCYASAQAAPTPPPPPAHRNGVKGFYVPYTGKLQQSSDGGNLHGSEGDLNG